MHREKRGYSPSCSSILTRSTSIAESTFLKRGCYNVMHEKPGESTTQTMSTNHSWHPSQSDIMCHVYSRSNHLIGYEEVKVKQTMTSYIIHYGVSLFSQMAKKIISCETLSFVFTRKSENICVFPIFLAIGFIWGISEGENTPFSISLSFLANLFRQFLDTQLWYLWCSWLSVNRG